MDRGCPVCWCPNPTIRRVTERIQGDTIRDGKYIRFGPVYEQLCRCPCHDAT